MPHAMPLPFRYSLAVIALVLSLLVTLPAIAQEGGRGHPCADVVEPVERLACYDDAFPPAGEEEAARKALEEFGLDEPALRLRNPWRGRDNSPDRIQAAVARVDYTANGERVLMLDNGQTWLQTEITSKGPLKPGDPVAIRKASFGTFMLATPGGVSLRVRRLR